jgi:hypothetical protein
MKSKARDSEKSTAKREDDDIGDELQAFKQKVYKEISELKFIANNQMSNK